MKNIKALLVLLIIILSSLMTSGCWNYRELEKLAIVAGFAIDKASGDNLRITIETLEFSGGKESKTTPKVITVEGKTIFETVRNGIEISGKKLYWSHAKVVIISEELAEEGVVRIIDWINRDSETRADVNVLIAKDLKAYEILKSMKGSDEIKSYELRDIMLNEKSLSKAPQVDILRFTNEISAEGLSAIAPVVMFKKIGQERVMAVSGTAIFKKDKLIGYLNEEETKDMLFVQNKIKGGVLTVTEVRDNKKIPISLEIFKNKTKWKLDVNNGNVRYYIYIYTSTAIDELGGDVNFLEEENRKVLEKDAERIMENRIDRLIHKLQKEYGMDIFGFGLRLRQDKPKIWKQMESNWGEKFQEMQYQVSVNIHIRNSAMLSKPMEPRE